MPMAPDYAAMQQMPNNPNMMNQQPNMMMNQQERRNTAYKPKGNAVDAGLVSAEEYNAMNANCNPMERTEFGAYAVMGMP